VNLFIEFNFKIKLYLWKLIGLEYKTKIISIFEKYYFYNLTNIMRLRNVLFFEMDYDKKEISFSWREPILFLFFLNFFPGYT